MGAGQAEHHITCGLRQTEQQTRQVCGNSLAEGAEESNHKHNPQHVRPLKQRTDINEHTHTYQEIGNEEGITDELDAVHQR